MDVSFFPYALAINHTHDAQTWTQGRHLKCRTATDLTTTPVGDPSSTQGSMAGILPSRWTSILRFLEPSDSRSSSLAGHQRPFRSAIFTMLTRSTRVYTSRRENPRILPHRGTSRERAGTGPVSIALDPRSIARQTTN